MAKAEEMKAEKPLRRTAELSGQEQVLEFIHRSGHPLKPVMAAAREIILGANQGITEHIKWNAPSFCFEGEDRVTFNLHREETILIVFHRGAKAKDGPGDGPLFEDPTGLLEWVTSDRASVKLYSLEDLNAKQDRLREVVNRWVTLK